MVGPKLLATLSNIHTHTKKCKTTHNIAHLETKPKQTYTHKIPSLIINQHIYTKTNKLHCQLKYSHKPNKNKIQVVKHKNTNTYKPITLKYIKHNHKHSNLKVIKHNQNSKTRHPSSPNQIQQSPCTKKLVCISNTITPSLSTQYRLKMARGSRGAARDLTVNQDFIMRDTTSPPLGTKRSGGNRTTSMKKKNKLAPKEVITPTTNFWLGFDMMKRLAFDEGAPLSFSLTPIHNLIKSGLSEKEAKEYLKSVHSYAHVS